MRKLFLLLGALSFMVVASLVYSQTATQQVDFEFTWTEPTTNEDGTELTDLGGYHLCISMNQPIPADLVFEDMPTACTTLAVTLPAGIESAVHTLDIAVRTAGTMYARIAAHDLSSNVSAFSNEASVDFDFLPPNGQRLNLIIRKK